MLKRTGTEMFRSNGQTKTGAETEYTTLCKTCKGENEIRVERALRGALAMRAFVGACGWVLLN